MPVACLHETQARAFVAGELNAEGRAVVEGHVATCEACKALVAKLGILQGSEDTVALTPGTDRTIASRPGTDPTLLVGAKPPAPLAEDAWAPGTKVGRYVVLARIGRGAMGTVFRAEDVELGRAVALKRLHADADAEARARLVREARSAAQLQHPNVVTVHEVGEDAGTPFLAMELVEGVTLTGWLREQPRTWREIVGIVAQAGRGLAAAHERGLVHRDFKPDNILVDRTGRARVADFGLARAGDAPATDPPTPITADARLGRMTQTGSIAGTPAYMAPELVEGAAPDARSDQYAFAVTLWEALRGQHPFAGDTAAALWVAMAEGKIREGGRAIPSWLERDVRRGLAVAPGERWPDVASFVAAIERAPRRTWLWASALLGAVAISTTGALFLWPRSHEASCDDLARDTRPPATHAELAAALKDPKQLELAQNAIDRYMTDYRKGVRDSCRATRAGTQSAALGDKRSACLEMARRRAYFVTSGLTEGFDKRASLATLLDGLPDVYGCGDPEWLNRASPLPVAQADRDALYAAENDLLLAGTVRDDGKLADASKLLDKVVATADKLGDRSLAARADLLKAEIAHDRGDMEQATTDAMEAWSAASAHGDTELTLRAQLAMLEASASRDKHAIEGFAGLGTDVSESAMGARLVVSYGDALMASGKFKAGEDAYRRAQTIREKVLPPEHIDRALGMMRIGAAIAIQKRSAEALPILEQANAIVEKAFPPLRREAIDGLRYLAMAHEDLGHLERALELKKEILKRRVQIHGESSGMALDARAAVGSALGDLGYDEEAAKELAAVADGFVALMTEKSVNAADARVSLANKLISLGRFAEADAALARAMPVLMASYGADSPYPMPGDYAQVRSWVERPVPIKLAEATKLLDRIEPTFAKLFGASSYPVAAVIYSRARIFLAKGDLEGAEALTVRALGMLGDDKRSDRAEIALFHARLQLRMGKRDQAIASAEASAKDYLAAGGGFATKAAASRAWAAKPAT